MGRSGIRPNRILCLTSVWSRQDVNARKGDRLPPKAGLKLLSVTPHLRNAHGVAEWKLFLNE